MTAFAGAGAVCATSPSKTRTTTPCHLDHGPDDSAAIHDAGGFAVMLLVEGFYRRRPVRGVDRAGLVSACHDRVR